MATIHDTAAKDSEADLLMPTTTATISVSTVHGLLHLPGEVRNLIYHHYVPEVKTSVASATRKLKELSDSIGRYGGKTVETRESMLRILTSLNAPFMSTPAMLLLNRQITAEVLPLTRQQQLVITSDFFYQRSRLRTFARECGVEECLLAEIKGLRFISSVTLTTVRHIVLDLELDRYRNYRAGVCDLLFCSTEEDEDSESLISEEDEDSESLISEEDEDSESLISEEDEDSESLASQNPALSPTSTLESITLRYSPSDTFKRGSNRTSQFMAWTVHIASHPRFMLRLEHALGSSRRTSIAELFRLHSDSPSEWQHRR